MFDYFLRLNIRKVVISQRLSHLSNISGFIDLQTKARCSTELCDPSNLQWLPQIDVSLRCLKVEHFPPCQLFPPMTTLGSYFQPWKMTFSASVKGFLHFRRTCVIFTDAINRGFSSFPWWKTMLLKELICFLSSARVASKNFFDLLLWPSCLIWNAKAAWRVQDIDFNTSQNRIDNEPLDKDSDLHPWANEIHTWHSHHSTFVSLVLLDWINPKLHFPLQIHFSTNPQQQHSSSSVRIFLFLIKMTNSRISIICVGPFM